MKNKENLKIVNLNNDLDNKTAQNVKFYADLFSKLILIIIADKYIVDKIGGYLKASVKYPNLAYLAIKVAVATITTIYANKISEYLITPVADKISEKLEIIGLNTSGVIGQDNKIYSSILGTDLKIISSDKAIISFLPQEYLDLGGLTLKLAINLIVGIYPAPIVNNIIAPIGNAISKCLDYGKDVIYEDYQKLSNMFISAPIEHVEPLGLIQNDY